MTDKPSIAAVLRHYGAERVPEGPGWRALRCPFHADTTASASVNTIDGAFTCHACGVKGDGLALIREQENCTFREAVEFAKDLDSDYRPDDHRARGGGRRQTVLRWSPPGRRGRAPWV